jgi:hypothetical protein
MATAGGYASANAATKPKCITKTSPLAVCSPVAVCQRAGSLALKISQSSNNIYMNNERPTPETDAAWAAWPYAGPGVHANFARKLERERNEARAELSNVYRWIERNHPDGFIDSQSHFQNLERVTEHIHDKMDKLERERDDTPWHSNGETKDEWFARQREKYIVVKRERNEARSLLAQYSAEREHNAMQALAHKADADSMREAIKDADKLLSAIGYLKKDMARSKLQPFLND